MKIRPLVLLLIAAGCAHAPTAERDARLAAPATAPAAPAPNLPAQPPPDDRQAAIVALGDSITFGLGDTNAPECGSPMRDLAGFPARLAALERVRVVNAGVCGETSREGRKRVQAVLERYRPEILLILYSPNDSRRDVDEVLANLQFMIAAARRQGAVPVIGTLTPAAGPHRAWEPFITALNRGIRGLAAGERVALADHYRAFESDPRFRDRPTSLLAPDGLHPNARGYDLMAQTWRRALHPAGAPREGAQGTP